MKKQNILKEAGVLLIVSVMVLSTVVVTANTNDLQIESQKYNTGSNNYSKGDIVWDNDMSYTDAEYAVWDEVNNFDFIVADDYIFTENTLVSGVKWVGGYVESGYQQGNFDWAIVFYNDDGTENAPGVITNYYLFTPAQYNKVFLEDMGAAIFYEYSVDLPEIIHFQANMKYWIAMFGLGEINPISIVGTHEPFLLHYAVFGSDYWAIPYWTDGDFDMCFQLVAPKPELDASGSLSWSDVEPGTVVKGSFEIDNIGESGSLLDWEVTEWPEWGTWIFEPEDGEDLTTESGPVTINVTVIAPDKPKENFLGHVTIVNTNNISDFDIIDVSLTTPKNKAFNFNFNLLSWLFERFPNVFPIIRHMLGM